MTTDRHDELFKAIQEYGRACRAYGAGTTKDADERMDAAYERICNLIYAKEKPEAERDQAE